MQQQQKNDIFPYQSVRIGNDCLTPCMCGWDSFSPALSAHFCEIHINTLLTVCVYSSFIQHGGRITQILHAIFLHVCVCFGFTLSGFSSIRRVVFFAHPPPPVKPKSKFVVFLSSSRASRISFSTQTSVTQLGLCKDLLLICCDSPPPHLFTSDLMFLSSLVYKQYNSTCGTVL